MQGQKKTLSSFRDRLYTSKTLAEIQFGEYLRNLTEELRYLHGRADITVQVFTEEIVLGLDTAIPLGLIANELSSLLPTRVNRRYNRHASFGLIWF